MTYAKMFQDDVNVYQHSSGGVICAMCYFCDDTEPYYKAESTQEMIDHLKAHQRIGHKMPDDIFERLLADDTQNYPTP
jgi:predicted patatin/cPLA2 family phospholipase